LAVIQLLLPIKQLFVEYKRLKKIVKLFSLQKREEGPGYTLRILKRSQVRNDPDNFALKILNKHWTVTHSFPLKNYAFNRLSPFFE